jgi:hypothetical protein
MFGLTGLLCESEKDLSVNPGDGTMVKQGKSRKITPFGSIPQSISESIHATLLLIIYCMSLK